MSIMLHITYNYALQTLCGAPHNVCNDNGIAENLPLNRMLGDYDIIHGTFFVCGLTSNDFTDLTPKQMKHYEEMYHDPQLFFLLCNKKRLTARLPAGGMAARPKCPAAIFCLRAPPGAILSPA